MTCLLLIKPVLAIFGLDFCLSPAKRKGWQVFLIYVGVDNVQTSIERVAQRVASGGHNVPSEDIRRRYARSLANAGSGNPAG